MARLPRFVIPGQPQHIIQRGNNREVTFVHNEDFRFYLEKLQNACYKHQCDVYAYILMTNHMLCTVIHYVEQLNPTPNSPTNNTLCIGLTSHNKPPKFSLRPSRKGENHGTIRAIY